MKRQFTWPTSEGIRAPAIKASTNSSTIAKRKTNRKHKPFHQKPTILRNAPLFNPAVDHPLPIHIVTSKASFDAKVKLFDIHDRTYARIMVKRKAMEALQLEDGQHVHVTITKKRRTQVFR